MTKEKFIEDSRTVLKFIQCYCDNEHSKLIKQNDSINLIYRSDDLNIQIPYSLCAECEKTLRYSYKKLQNCPHEEKTSCRKCHEPCYEKREWKLLAKIMRYSGMKLGFIKIKNMFKSLKKVV